LVVSLDKSTHEGRLWTMVASFPGAVLSPASEPYSWVGLHETLFRSFSCEADSPSQRFRVPSSPVSHRISCLLDAIDQLKNSGGGNLIRIHHWRTARQCDYYCRSRSFGRQFQVMSWKFGFAEDGSSGHRDLRGSSKIYTITCS